MGTKHNNSIESTLFDFVAPHEGHGAGSIVSAYDLNAVLVGLGDLIVENLRLIVLNLNAHSADLNLVLNDIGIHVESGYDG